ncbi:MAG: hypothetical protein ACJAW3_000367 [Lentimonas sp.]|jgi:hypothetical protein
MSEDTSLEEITFKEITTENNLFCQFEESQGVLFLDVNEPFTESDFEAISGIIDPFFSTYGELQGIIINCKKFPYWKGAKNRTQYLNFAGDNHHKFKKAALSMGGFFIKVVLIAAKNRVHPKIKTFKFNKIEEAQRWVLHSK